MVQEFRRPLFVAYEPWETRIASAFIDKWASDREGAPALLIADPYQIRNNKGARRLKRLGESPHFEAHVAFRDLASWQQTIGRAKSAETSLRLEEISRSQGLNSLDRIMKSDVHLYPRERSPFYGPMTPPQREMAAVLVFERVIEIFDKAEPDAVVMMLDQYLVKNFAAALAVARGIPVRVFRRVRYQDYLKCDDFFLADPHTPAGDPASFRPAEGFSSGSDIRSEIEQFGESLYSVNLARESDSTAQRYRRHPFTSAITVVVNGVKAQFKKLSFGQWTRPKEFRYLKFWVSIPWRGHIFFAMRTLRTLGYIMNRNRFAGDKEIPERYIAIPLHFRPESAVLTKGYGLEDDDIVVAVAQHLKTTDPHVACVVLEHPSMIEYRRSTFYRHLRKSGNVIFADPTVSTQKLVRESLGVVTISGTVALEASIAEIPVHAAGRPDYLSAIRSRGMDQLEGFLRGCVNGTAEHSKETVLEYFENRVNPRWRGHLSWAAIASEETIETTVATLMDMFDTSTQRH